MPIRPWNAEAPHKCAHITPYITSKRIVASQCKKHQPKDSIWHLEARILKYDKKSQLAAIANETHQLHKWLKNDI